MNSCWKITREENLLCENGRPDNNNNHRDYDDRKETKSCVFLRVPCIPPIAWKYNRKQVKFRVQRSAADFAETKEDKTHCRQEKNITEKQQQK